jgi:uncharacterized protein
MTDHARPSTARLALHTADGLALQAELADASPTARAAAVLAHPHPLHGGSMHATVVDALFGALPAAGVTCLRFNFRGVQGSQGRHGYGRDERADVAAAVDALATHCPGAPIVAAGWSFGADVALSLGDERIAGWLAVAPPLRVLPVDELVAGATGRPVLLAVPAHDQFCPPDDARRRTEGWPARRVVEIPMADHFLTGHLPEVVDLATAFVDELVRGCAEGHGPR